MRSRMLRSFIPKDCRAWLIVMITIKDLVCNKTHTRERARYLDVLINLMKILFPFQFMIDLAMKFPYKTGETMLKMLRKYCLTL